MMGRFEKRPDSPRARGDLSRSAENALWAVVEDLENLQQNVLKSLQEDVKRLEGDKKRLADDIQRLIEEREKLQQTRQITEQQVLIRQLAEVLAKHISSQLQSSLAALATRTIEGESYERTPLKSAEVNGNSHINESVGQMLDTLDDSVTITFNSLQQELKNYQSSLSQQLSRMYSQQQQGEAILAEFVNRLHEELENNQELTPRQVATTGVPTVLQRIDPQVNSSSETSSVIKASEPISSIPKELPKSSVSSPLPTEPISVIPYSNNISEPPVSSPLPTEPVSVIPYSNNISEPPVSSPLPSEPVSVIPYSNNISEPPVSSPLPSEPVSVISQELPNSNNISEPTFTAPQPAEPISVLRPDLSDLSESAITFSPVAESAPQENTSEPISVLNPDLSEDTTISPPPDLPTPKLPQQEDASEPISVLRSDLSTSETTPRRPAASVPKRGATPARRRSRSSANSSPIQVGLVLLGLSTVISSLYNVTIKAIFQPGSEILGGLEPTVGNILLMSMLRLLVVVPLMLLLAPILHPPVWDDLQNLLDTKRRNALPDRATKQRVLLLSIVSGCFLFLSQVLIYLAIGEVATGIAIALFFIYPLISGLLSLFLFRDRPQLWGIAAIVAIVCGELLVLGSSTNMGIGNTAVGTSAAIFSGIAFAVYLILSRLCADKLHPVSLTLINFATMLGLSLIFLLVPLPSSWSIAINSSKLLEVVLSAFILGVLSLCSYLFNNFGNRQLGGSRSLIIGAAVPVLTVIFAGLMIQETLDIVQILGVLLVTFGAAAFIFDKMRNQAKPSNSAN